MMMKAVYLAVALMLTAAASAAAEGHDSLRSRIQRELDRDYHRKVRTDLTVLFNKDFAERPTVDEAVAALGNDALLGGFGWQVVIGHVGLGGNYLAGFVEESDSAWWVRWNGQAIYTSFHLFEPDAFLDPFVSAGAGCSGQVYIGPSGNSGEGLAISLYPFLSAGIAVNLKPYRLGAELLYAPWSSQIPVTSIPESPLGAFQVSVFAGFGL